MQKILKNLVRQQANQRQFELTASRQPEPIGKVLPQVLRKIYKRTAHRQRRSAA